MTSSSSARGPAVSVTYRNYADDPQHVINGTESVAETHSDPLTTWLDWRSNLVASGGVRATKMTSADGFRLTINVMANIVDATGTLTTTVGDRVYAQPKNGA